MIDLWEWLRSSIFHSYVNICKKPEGIQSYTIITIDKFTQKTGLIAQFWASHDPISDMRSSHLIRYLIMQIKQIQIVLDLPVGQPGLSGLIVQFPPVPIIWFIQHWPNSYCSYGLPI